MQRLRLYLGIWRAGNERDERDGVYSALTDLFCQCLEAFVMVIRSLHSVLNLAHQMQMHMKIQNNLLSITSPHFTSHYLIQASSAYPSLIRTYDTNIRHPHHPQVETKQASEECGTAHGKRKE